MNSVLRRFLVVAVPGLLIGVLSAAPALADSPRIFLGPAAPFVLPAPDYCNFPVQIAFPDFKQYGIVRSNNADGTQTLQVNGHATATVTNQANDKSVSYNISGPGTAVFNPNGGGFIQSADIKGPNLLWTASQNLQNFPKVPTISYTTGHLTFAVDPASRQTISYSLAGGNRQTDVCAALA